MITALLTSNSNFILSTQNYKIQKFTSKFWGVKDQPVIRGSSAAPNPRMQLRFNRENYLDSCSGVEGPLK